MKSAPQEGNDRCVHRDRPLGQLGRIGLVSRHEEIDVDNGEWNITNVSLSEQERAELQEIAGKGTHAASKVINALILLNCDQSGGRTQRPRTCDIATMLCVSERKVDRIKKKFVLEGLDLTLNRQPSKCEYDLKIDGRLEAQLLAMSCSAPPEGQARWSLRLLADELVELELVDSISHETVRRTLKKTNSSPGGKSAGLLPRKRVRHS